MTPAEREEARREWLSNAKVGDEVCISNINDSMIDTIFDDMLGFKEIDSPRVCIINIIRGILPDGSYVVGNDIFDHEGMLVTGKNNNYLQVPKLCEPTDERKNIAWRNKFKKDITEINWDNIDNEGIHAIILALNDAIKRKEIADEQAAKEREEAARIKAEEEEKKKQESPIKVTSGEDMAVYGSLRDLTTMHNKEVVPAGYVELSERISALEELINKSSKVEE